MQEIITSFIKSVDNICHRLKMLAPNTFLTPISFVRCSATKDASPNNPKQEIKTARMAKKVERFPMRFSSENFSAYTSSVNLNSNGLPGSNFLNTASIFGKAALKGKSGFIRTVIRLVQLGSYT